MLVWFHFQQKGAVGLFLPVQPGFDINRQIVGTRIFEPSDQWIPRGETLMRCFLLCFPLDRLQHTLPVVQVLAQDLAQVLRLQAVLEAVVGEV